MAQLKDTVVSGNLRVTDSVLTDVLQADILKVRTSSSATTYGPGTSGQVIKSNGTNSYWDTLTQANIFGSSAIGGLKNFVYYNGTSLVATTQGLGSSTKPLYLSSGTLTECSSYAGGTAVTLNNASKAAATASFYAPTAGGTSGYLLIGKGTTTAPDWSNVGFIDATNSRFGIGTTSPAYKLDVNGTTHTTSLIVGTTADAKNVSLVWDDTNKAWHLNGNFYADGFVSAGGLSNSGGSSGIDEAAMWESLSGNSGAGYNQQINVAHLTNLVSSLNLGTAATYGVASSVTQNDTTHLVTGAAVWTAIDNLPEPMIFKGSLGTGGTITTLPAASSANEGFTYKVITAGTYASQSAKIGDLFISNGSSWIWIPSGDEPSGTVTSVALAVPTGLSVSGSPITSSGTITISLTSGYTIPTSSDVSNGVTAYGYFSSGVLPYNHGGTGQSSWTKGQILYASANNTLAKLDGNSTTTKKFLSMTSSTPSWTTLAASDISNLSISSGIITIGSNTITPVTAVAVGGSGHTNEIAVTSGGSTSYFTVPFATSATSATSATTATKLGSATVGSSTLPIYLNSGTATAITSFPEAYLSWGGKNFSGNYGPIDAAMVSELGACRTMFANPAGIVVEYSTDSGATWSDYAASDVQKQKLFSTGESIYLGKQSTSGTISTTSMLRITINTSAASIYSTLNKFVIRYGTSWTSGGYCTIICRKQTDYEANNDVWMTLADQVPISGWTGYNVINTSNVTTYGNQAASQYGQLRFIFGFTTVTPDKTGTAPYVLSILGYGGFGWTVPSYMAKHGHIYDYNYQQDATFPGAIVPKVNNTKTLGNSNYRWSGIYGVNADFSGTGTISGNTTIGGTLGVTGNTTLSGTLTVGTTSSNKTTTLNGNLYVSGGIYVGTGRNNGSYVGSDSTTNIWLHNSAGYVLVADGKVVRRGTSLSDVTLGSSAYPWGGLFSTTGSFSSTLAVTGATTLSSTLSVASLATMVSGVKLTTTKKIWFGDTYYIELDSNNRLHTNAGFYSDSFVSAGGVSSSSGGGGVDIDAVWASFTNSVTDDYTNTRIAQSHLPAISSSGSGVVSAIAYSGSGNNLVLSVTKTAVVTSLGSKTGAITLSGGLSIDSNNVLSSTDTKNTAGADNTTSKIFLVGPTAQTSSNGNARTYSNVNCYASGGKLYSNAKEVVNLSDTQTLTNKTYNGLTLTAATTGFTISGGTTSKTLTVSGTYTLGAACAKAVDTSISAASTSANLPTSAAVASFVEGKGYITSYTNTTYKLSLNGTTNGDSTNGVNLGTLYAPTGTGTANQILLSTGSTTKTPAWSSSGLGASNKPIYLNSSGVLTAGDACLKLTGGTLSGTLTISKSGADHLIIDRTGSTTNPSWVQFQNAGTLIGYIGIHPSKYPVYNDGNGNTYTIYHSGNLTPGNYVLKAGDTMTGALTVSTTSIYDIYVDNTTSSATMSGYRFKVGGTVQGGICVSTGHVLYFNDTTADRTVYHSGNFTPGNYLLLSGGTMTGTLTALGSQYTDDYTGALNMSNSNIYGVNGIYTADLANNAAEGINFYRTTTTVDSLWAASGVLYFTPNRTLGTDGTSYTVFHSGNYTSTFDGRYVKKAGDIMTGTLTFENDSTPSDTTQGIRGGNIILSRGNSSVANKDAGSITFYSRRLSGGWRNGVRLAAEPSPNNTSYDRIDLIFYRSNVTTEPANPAWDEAFRISATGTTTMNLGSALTITGPSVYNLYVNNNTSGATGAGIRFQVEGTTVGGIYANTDNNLVHYNGTTNYRILTAGNYGLYALPLSAGGSYPLTGHLFLNEGLGIQATGGIGLLVYHPTSGWSGISSTQWGIGSIDSPGIIRSNATNLTHYKSNTAYDIWDASNSNLISVPWTCSTLTLPNGGYIYGKDTSNTDVAVLAVSSSNNIALGYGILGKGTTNIYGNAISFRPTTSGTYNMINVTTGATTTDNGPALKFFGPNANKAGGSIEFYSRSRDTLRNGFKIEAIYAAAGDKLSLDFYSSNNGDPWTSVWKRALRITYAGNTIIGTSDSSSNLTVYGTITSSGDQVISSDATLKTNWRELGYGVKDIAGCTAGIFDWKDGHGTSAGTKAQDWEKLVPQLVHGNDGNKTLAYGQVALLNTILLARHETEQDKEISDLRKRIEELESELNKLKG